MIAGIQGVLKSIETDRVLIEPTPGSGAPGMSGIPGLILEVLVPGYVINRLGASIGKTVQFTTLTYLESQNQGNSFVPRLAGFLSAQDKAFFELLVTVKGIGNRKALRAMALPCHQIANAIADRDAKTLQALPEIGKRSAETIIVDLKNKIDPFLHAPAPGSGQPSGAAETSAGGAVDSDTIEPSSEPSGDTSGGGGGGAMTREALQTLVTLGENRLQALEWIEKAMQQDPPPSDTGALISAAFRLKAGG